MPLFSIITPVFNRQHLIGKTIISVISQTHEDWEMLIIDDGSTDGTISIVQMYEQQDKRIKLVHRDRPPKGAATCRNLGLQRAMGKYVIFLDSDDQLRPFALRQRRQALTEYPDFDFLVFQTIKKDLQTGKEYGLWHEFSPQENHLTEFLSLRSPWQTAGPVWKISSLLKHSLFFDEKLRIWQDVDFHLMVLYKKPTYKLISDYPADVIYNVHRDTLSQRSYDYKQRRSQIYFLHKHLMFNKNNSRAKEILKQLCTRLIYKNFEQRYFDNVIRLLWLKHIKMNMI